MEYYRILGVDITASPVEIKKAYRRLARQYHPDLNPGENTALHFIRIKNAYDTLQDPVKRQDYDDAMFYTGSTYGSAQEQAEQAEQNAQANYHASSGEEIFKRKEKPVDDPAEDPASASIQLIAFSLAEEEYALRIGDVLGIVDFAALKPPAHANSLIEGMIHMRGEELPVVDLAMNIGFFGAGDATVKRIIIVEIEQIKVGLIVETVPVVIDLPKNQIFDVPARSAKAPSRFLQVGRIDERMIIILDLDQILAPATLTALRELDRNKD